MKDLVKIPLNILLEYREFDRNIEQLPKIMGIYIPHTVSDIKKLILDNGLKSFEEPILLLIDADNNKAILLDGNHRVTALGEMIEHNSFIDVKVKKVRNIETHVKPKVIAKMKPITFKIN